MKNLKCIFGILLSLAVLAFSIPVSARQIGGLPSTAPDAWSVFGGSPACYSGGTVVGCEVAVDYTGNLVPTVTNAQTLGSASLLWSNAYFQAVNSGAVGTANVTGTGNATAPTSETIVGGIVLQPSQIGNVPSSTSGIDASTTIPYVGTYELLLATAPAVVMTSVPTISTRTVPGTGALWPTGTYLVLTSTGSGTITLQSQGTLTNSGLRLGAATRIITVGNQLTLIFNATIGQWVEAAFSAGTGN